MKPTLMWVLSLGLLAIFQVEVKNCEKNPVMYDLRNFFIVEKIRTRYYYCLFDVFDEFLTVFH